MSATCASSSPSEKYPLRAVLRSARRASSKRPLRTRNQGDSGAKSAQRNSGTGHTHCSMYGRRYDMKPSMPRVARTTPEPMKRPHAQQMLTNEVRCARTAMGQSSAAYAVVRTWKTPHGMPMSSEPAKRT